jgi:predicted amidohydrolase YtcJ
MDKKRLIVKGNCLTMGEPAVCGWIAIQDGIILQTGKKDQWPEWADDSWEILDAGSCTVIPGFIDSHFHLVQAAINQRSMDLSDCTSFEEIGRKIQQASAKNPGMPIRGIGLDQQKLIENRLPTRADLDLFCNDAPVFLNSVEYQKSVLNTYALLYYKIPFTLEGVEFDRNQMPTGIISHHANSILRGNVLRNIPNTKRMEAVQELMQEVVQKGITTINAMEGGRMYSDKDAEFVYESKDSFSIDVTLFYQTMDIELIKEMNLNRIGGCFYLDGTFSARTAALSFDYADSPGTRGGLNFTQEELNEFVLECYSNKLQLALYTIGDRAIEQALTAHEQALARTGNYGLRHRLEHAELPSVDHLKRAADLGILFSMTPAYEYFWGGPGKMNHKRLGDHYRLTNPLRRILDAGIIICGGSDCDVTPADPMLGIHAAVNHPVLEHRVSLMEALRMYTINGAYGIFEEKIKGSLEPGKTADIIILDRDLLETPPEELKEVKVSVTLRKGERLY